jgi:hypothetical protein
VQPYLWLLESLHHLHEILELSRIQMSNLFESENDENIWLKSRNYKTRSEKCILEWCPDVMINPG